MGAALLFLATAAQIAGGTGQAALTLRDEAVIDRAELRLGDLTDVTILPPSLRDHARALILTRSIGSQRASISDLQLVARVRAIMPALRPWLPATTGKSIEVRRQASERAEFQDRSCARANRDVVQGAVLSARDFDAVACSGSQPAAARHDPGAGVSRAGRLIATGEVIVGWPGLDGGQIVPGQKILIASGSGPVRVEHTVEAVQSAWPGQRVFVRSSDGQVHSVRYKAMR